MSIRDFTEKIKPHLANFKDQIYSKEKGLKIKDDLYIVLLILLVGTASFGLGKISAYEKNKTPIAILNTKEALTASVLDSQTTAEDTATQSIQSTTQSSGEVVASKSGTKYYYPWCSGVSRIKEENKVWFKTIDEAKATGLTPATNCAGLK